MATTEQSRIEEALGALPLSPDASLNGWVALAEWRAPNGDIEITLIGSPDAHVVQVKGYLHEGLFDIARGVYRVAGGHLEDVRFAQGS